MPVEVFEVVDFSKYLRTSNVLSIVLRKVKISILGENILEFVVILSSLMASIGSVRKAKVFR